MPQAGAQGKPNPLDRLIQRRAGDPRARRKGIVQP
jgi:hypothetical protein